MTLSQKARPSMGLILLLALSVQACGVIGFNTKTQKAKIERANDAPSPVYTDSDSAVERADNTEDAGQGQGFPSLSIPAAGALFLEDGVASWYGPKFHGKATANGETYDMDGLTAAHRTLAFNSKVKVTNLENGKSVIVRINDRGPYAKSRIIDLSRKAARDIDMIQNGTAKVRLELLEGKLTDASGFCSICDNFAVQLAAFTNAFDARTKADEIKGAYVQSSENDGKKVYRVLYGKFEDRAAAERALGELRTKGIDGFVRQLENLQ
jgi:rare lipoprotein A